MHYFFIKAFKPGEAFAFQTFELALKSQQLIKFSPKGIASLFLQHLFLEDSYIIQTQSKTTTAEAVRV